MNCLKRKDSLLSDLSIDELKILDNNRKTINYKSGETICNTGTKPLGLMCLTKGKVKIVRSSMNASEHIIGLKKAVEFIGFRALISGNSCMSSYIALENSSICVISKNDFFNVIERNKTLAFKIMKSLAEELVQSNNRLVNLTQKHMRARLAEAILLIHDVYGINPENGALNASLKRSDLAGLANMTTANAIRVLSKFKDEQLVDIDHRKITLTDIKTLKTISTLNLH